MQHLLKSSVLLGLAAFSLTCTLRHAFHPELRQLYGGPMQVGVSPGQPVYASLDDPTCTAERALEDLGKREITINRPDGSPRMLFDFSGVSGKGLSNRYVAGAYHGAHVVMAYDGCKKLVSNRYQCDSFHQEVVNPGELIYYCRPGTYAEESVESIALTMMAAVIKTSRNYQRISALDWPRDVKLHIHPRIEQRITLSNGMTLKFFRTENARWTNIEFSGSSYAIEFFPHIKGTVSRGRNPIYLQMGVASHEFGHHLYNSRAPDLMAADYELLSLSGYEVDLFEAYASSPKAKAKRSITAAMVNDAFNEGYADLVAYYTYNAGDSPIGRIEIDHRVRARAPNAQGYDYTTKEKLLNKKTLDAFFSPLYLARKGMAPSSQDVHTIGAILAYSLNKLFKFRVGDTHVTTRALERWKLLNATLDKANTLYRERGAEFAENPRLLLEEIVWGALVSAALERQQDGKILLAERQCEVVKRRFPVYAPRWADKYSCARP